MRFCAWMPDVMCGKSCPSDEEDGAYACLRVASHSGECASVMFRAAELDGVRFCCRVKTGTPHHERCPRFNP